MTIKVGGARPHPQNGTVSHKGTELKPSPYHGGSGLLKGRVHEAPTRPAVNSANYAAQRVRRK
jgi:hypothetical protein